jgi:RNA-binding protein YhbY
VYGVESTGKSYITNKVINFIQKYHEEERIIKVEVSCIEINKSSSLFLEIIEKIFDNLKEDFVKEYYDKTILKVFFTKYQNQKLNSVTIVNFIQILKLVYNFKIIFVIKFYLI